MLAYLDASAWVKLYASEQGSDAMAALWSDPGIELTASWLACVEVRATLSRTRAPEDIRAHHLDDRELVGLIDVGNPIVLMADHIASSYRLRAGDAIHLATAIAVAALRDAVVTFVTCDADLAEAARACGIEVLDPAS